MLISGNFSYYMYIFLQCNKLIKDQDHPLGSEPKFVQNFDFYLDMHKAIFANFVSKRAFYYQKLRN